MEDAIFLFSIASYTEVLYILIPLKLQAKICETKFDNLVAPRV